MKTPIDNRSIEIVAWRAILSISNECEDNCCIFDETYNTYLDYMGVYGKDKIFQCRFGHVYLDVICYNFVEPLNKSKFRLHNDIWSYTMLNGRLASPSPPSLVTPTFNVEFHGDREVFIDDLMWLKLTLKRW